MNLIDIHESIKKMPGLKENKTFDAGLLTNAIDQKISAYFQASQAAEIIEWVSNESKNHDVAKILSVVPPYKYFKLDRESLVELKRIKNFNTAYATYSAYYSLNNVWYEARFPTLEKIFLSCLVFEIDEIDSLVKGIRAENPKFKSSTLGMRIYPTTQYIDFEISSGSKSAKLSSVDGDDFILDSCNFCHLLSGLEFDEMPLSIVESDCDHRGELLKGPVKTGGGILSP